MNGDARGGNAGRIMLRHGLAVGPHALSPATCVLVPAQDPVMDPPSDVRPSNASYSGNYTDLPESHNVSYYYEVPKDYVYVYVCACEWVGASVCIRWASSDPRPS